MSEHFQDIFQYRKKIQEIPGLLEFPGHVHNLLYVLQVSYMRFVNFVSSNINKKKSCFFFQLKILFWEYNFIIKSLEA